MSKVDLAEYRKRGAAFGDVDVARAYRHRADYPEALFEALVERAPGRERALDLGTGPGKIAGRLARYFKKVDALDPSRAMLDEARAQWPAPNISWICARTEEAALEGPYDLVTAGASIHWMEPGLTFPKIAALLAGAAKLALIGGDGPTNPPWAEEWRGFLERRAARQGGTYDDFRSAVRETLTHWLSEIARLSFSREMRQSIPDYLESLHAHSTWARYRMGDEAAAFDREVSALLAPYAKDGLLTYTVETKVTLCRPRVG